MKRKLVIGMIMLALVFPGAACASPLYGGYNGESEAWFEVYIVESADILFSLRISIGFDSDLTHLWVRAGISSLFLAPFNISSVGISYETGNIISASLDAILPWPFQVGADTNNLVWGVTSFLVGVSGSDSDGNVWVEAGVPGVTACGEVTQENGQENDRGPEKAAAGAGRLPLIDIRHEIDLKISIPERPFSNDYPCSLF